MNLRLALASFLLALPAAARAESAAAPYILIKDVSVTEGDSGKTHFETTVTLLSWFQPIEVDVQAFAGSATAEDFSFPVTHLKLMPGTPQTVSGEVIGDIDVEGDETFNLRATTSQGPYYVFSSGGNITIVDDDQARAPRLTIDNATVAEGDQGSTRVGLKVHLAPAVTYPVELNYRTVDHTASAAGMDYTAVSSSLTFAPGETLKSIAVDVIGDQLWEADETLAVELVSARRAVIGSKEGIITITNDDAPVSVTIDDLKAPEGNGGNMLVEVSAHLSRPAPPLMKVFVNFVGGSARLGEDFSAKGQTLYPLPGATEIPFAFEILSDTIPECDEGFTIEYSAAYSGDDTKKTARVLIENDDGPTGPGCADPYVPPPPPDGGAPDAGPDGSAMTTDGRPPFPNEDSSTLAPTDAPGVDAGAQLASKSSGCSVGPGTLGASPLLLAALALLLRRRARR
jgi:hypothetical protein